VFPNPSRVDWIERAFRPIHDPDASTDYGNIDTFDWDGSRFVLVGEWGHVAITSEPPLVVDHVAV